MSNPETIVIDPSDVKDVTSEKQSFLQKSLNTIKTHKKVVIATAGLAGLVGAAALLGRNSDPEPIYYVGEVDETIEPEVDPTVD